MNSFILRVIYSYQNSSDRWYDSYVMWNVLILIRLSLTKIAASLGKEDNSEFKYIPFNNC